MTIIGTIGRLVVQNIQHLIILCIGALYIFSSFPVFSSGDGGELVTSSYLFGIAHPPGYPLYIELAKLFSFIPIGNIAQRIALVSITSSIVSLYLIYKIALLITKDKFISIFPVILLGVSYSFFYNSIVQKFYTVSLLLILVIIYILLKEVIQNKVDIKNFYLISFLLGIGFMIHQTVMFLSIPVIIVVFLYYKELIKPKQILIYLILFLAPLLINIHMYVSSIKNRYYAIVKSSNWEEFIRIFLRKNYGVSTDQAVVGGIFSVDGILNWISNIVHIINVNYTYASILLIFTGFIYLWKLNKKLFIVFFSVFLMFGPVLGKITLSSKLTPWNSYVVVNQYFLPFLSVLVLLITFGLYFFFKLVSRKLYYMFAISSYFVAITLLPATFITTNQSKNWVPYYHVKDILSLMPVSSVLIAIGDSYNFGLWYMKLVGRYRDDVCHLASYNYTSMNFGIWGCSPTKLYSNLIPEMKKGIDLSKLAERNMLFSTFALSKSSPLYPTFDSRPYLYVYIYFKKDSSIDENYLKEISLNGLKYITPDVCTTHGVDDLYTKEMCVTFSNGYIFLASYIKPLFILENNKSKFTMLYTHYYGSEEFGTNIDIYPSEENQQYLNQYSLIQKYNNLSKYYLWGE